MSSLFHPVKPDSGRCGSNLRCALCALIGDNRTTPRRNPRVPHTVTLQASGKRFEVQPGETVLEAARRAGLALPYSCLAGNLCLDPSEMAVGLDINANHVRAVTAGVVTGTARAVHVGRSTQVWEIRIEDERAKLVCISRLTLAVVPRETPKPI